ncbi:MAG: hypothetical protein KJ697_02725 [Nanoarchaeota archaeon]|nr:hypothetical protein [Nanoarchaeota archaeon]
MKADMIQNIPSFVNKQVETRFSEIESKLKKTIECEKELMEFEILSSIAIKPQKKIHEAIKEERVKAWKESLKKANGNKEKAIEIFDQIYP